MIIFTLIRKVFIPLYRKFFGKTDQLDGTATGQIDGVQASRRDDRSSRRDL